MSYANLGLVGVSGLAGLMGLLPKACTAERVDEGVEITCPTQKPVLLKDNVCHAEQLENGVEIRCDGSDNIVYLRHGLNGEKGEKGADGDGKQGAPGADGQGCRLQNLDNGAKITCGENSVTLTNGVDGPQGPPGNDGNNFYPGTWTDYCTYEVTFDPGDNEESIEIVTAPLEMRYIAVPKFYNTRTIKVTGTHSENNSKCCSSLAMRRNNRDDQVLDLVCRGEKTYDLNDYAATGSTDSEKQTNNDFTLTLVTQLNDKQLDDGKITRKGPLDMS